MSGKVEVGLEPPRVLKEPPSPGRRAWARLGATLLNGAIAAGLLFFLLDRFVPPQHLPWTPFSFDQPIGAFTSTKLAVISRDPARCRRALADGRLRFSEAPARESAFCSTADSVILAGGSTALAPAGPVMICPLALRYALWERQVVRPAARELLGTELRRVEHYGTYSCRRIYGRQTGRPSAHARAAALDVASFRFTNGRRMNVEAGWNGSAAEAAFLRRVRDGGCRVFGTVLSPDYNAAHADHLHLEGFSQGLCG